MEKHFNILFLCNRNSARSIIAEALVTTLSHGRFIGFSAGAQPSGFVHPYAIEMAKAMGYPVRLLRSKSWDEFGREGAPKMDFIITLCDAAMGEECPHWPGHPSIAHWGFSDPAAIDASDVNGMLHAFKQVEIGLRNRIELLMDLPIEKLDRLDIQERLHNIHFRSKFI
ncbi:MAG: protein-tyrosine-phosphatase [Polynucleobacter sp. 24-46-87]|jgi:arsenate reductase|nr:MAG: protein-tyrosine-phosphatase [Polynucleobacter sp. 32-46-5]OYY59367.1 MAG: protein-tyrosine-phosphatase [Polynucleobacter sp. 35-46-207]OYZ39049.1 MAG: protein-tyrosine-phosphatase [Polynucleobacter sp. 16-46-70]OZA15097.1 MAG: protein-tyrosine-phosphatase [Polynucleobacter sp. 24-46-87]OZA42097.1 MAG: protein-tyrosine-phosphatase [Polynucleobacter sp. 17-46-58]OZB49660.1 MAG: protein-tyrosine-phosphatase [Polynucleobacter sp. 39-45-136]HQR83373.1 arsenate reductase ArsC [Polynucleoba